ncbi:hypothetical protein, conserved [Eimeria tenella]|uniref:NADP-dependent oxidoreductase domain-containing protein n=1 Tax=Eimeria tenella TaxID=5802 RepID=U6KX59_EIMTE|nr:hypothetical protein, conserved [Eimeria tenella]CDJ40914.1 hypothetical protein, conserved [Eimeria tenella]|eukprot:XP_013231664.1 hypothetical protein, conserved [Eimeria tenella]
MRAPAPLCLLPGMRRSPEREEQWRFIPEAPYGILASRQNFARSFTAKDKAWIEKVIENRRRRAAQKQQQQQQQQGAETQARPAAAADTAAAAANTGAAADEDPQRPGCAEEPLPGEAGPPGPPEWGPPIGEPGEVLPPPPLPARPGGLLMTPEEAYHRQYAHVALPLSTGCAAPKLLLPNRLQLPPTPTPGAPRGPLGAPGGALREGGPPWPVAYRQLGQSDLYVSEVGLGTMFMGGPQGPPAGKGNCNNPSELLSYAVDGWGVNFIDTAELYPLPAAAESFGAAEEIVGKWLAARGAAKRAELVLAAIPPGSAALTAAAAQQQHPSSCNGKEQKAAETKTRRRETKRKQKTKR